jgi:transposase
MAYPRLTIAPHLDPDEIARRYRACDAPVERSRWHALWLMTRPDGSRSADQAARLLGYSGNWARALVKRYNERGPDGLVDRRAGNGQRPKLSAAQRAELLEALREAPPDGGLWSGPKLAAHVRDRYGVSLSHTSAWDYLVKLGFRLRAPRPRHPKAATAEEQAEWKRRPGRARPRAAPRASRQGGRAVGRG